MRERTMFEIFFKDNHKEVLHNGEDLFGYFMIEYFQEPDVSTLVKLFSHIKMHVSIVIHITHKYTNSCMQFEATFIVLCSVM